MQFDVITIFPDIFETYFDQSILEKAQGEQLNFNIHDLRDFTSDKHNSVDDKPFGGGRGMVMKVEPIYKTVKEIKSNSEIKEEKRKVILFSPRGKKFNQKKASGYKDLDQLILICGRYEGIDERVAKHIADEILSIGDYVLMGGEIPALAVIESIARLVPGVVGKSSDLLEKRATDKGSFLEYPQYTRPEKFKTEEGDTWEVPEVLLSGHHKKIRKWREKKSKEIG